MKNIFRFSDKNLHHSELLKELLSSSYCHKMKGLTFGDIKKVFDKENRPIDEKKLRNLVRVWKKRGKCDSSKKENKLAYFIIGGKKQTKNTKVIFSLLSKVKNKEEKEFVEEAISCLKIDSGKSTIIMLWCSVLYKIYNSINKKGLKNFNNMYSQRYGNKKSKPPVIKKIDDFEYYPDSEVLLISEDLGIFDRAQRRILEDCLKLRNMCAHPSKYRPKEHKVNSFVEDILGVVFI